MEEWIYLVGLTDVCYVFDLLYLNAKYPLLNIDLTATINTSYKISKKLQFHGLTLGKIAPLQQKKLDLQI